MADNTTLPGTGEIIRDKQLASDGTKVRSFQAVLLTGSAGAWVEVPWPGDAANGIDVDVTRMPPLVAGAAHIGEVSLDAAGLAALETTTANQGAAAGIGSPWPVYITDGFNILVPNAANY